MKVSPIASSANTARTSGGTTEIRSVKMNTNATPGRSDAPPPDPKMAIPDPIVDPAVVTPEATEPLSPQLAALAKQKRALQVKERELLDREKALATQAPTQGDVITKAQLKSDPLSMLLEAGVTYDQLTEAILADQNGDNSRVKALEAKIAALETGLDKKLTDRDTQAEGQVLAEMQKDATKLIAEGDTYELVRETKSLPHVMELIKRTYKETGEVLDVGEALQLIEDDLVQESLKIAGLGKVKSRMTAPAAPPQQRQGMKTLTNRDTASVQLSPKQRAIAAFNGTLKK